MPLTAYFNERGIPYQQHAPADVAGLPQILTRALRLADDALVLVTTLRETPLDDAAVARELPDCKYTRAGPDTALAYGWRAPQWPPVPLFHNSSALIDRKILEMHCIWCASEDPECVLTFEPRLLLAIPQIRFAAIASA